MRCDGVEKNGGSPDNEDDDDGYADRLLAGRRVEYAEVVVLCVVARAGGR